MSRKSCLGILGVGTMGEALVQGIQASTVSRQLEILGSRRTQASAREIADRHGIRMVTDNKEIAKQCEILVLAVKPQQAEAVVREISPLLQERHVLVSICASVSLLQLKTWTEGRCSVLRAMPNTPAIVGEAMTVICPEASLKEDQLGKVEAIFATMGKVARLEEHLMDAATGLSGCGPAYVFLMIEALSEAGVKLGISRKTATLLAAQTLLGAAKMVLERGDHPAAMKDEVTTPAGCTVDGLMALEEGKLRVTLVKGVLAAARRSATLAR